MVSSESTIIRFFRDVLNSMLALSTPQNDFQNQLKVNVCRESSFRLKQSAFGRAKMIPKSCAKLAQVSFVQIPEPISKIITLNRVYN